MANKKDLANGIVSADVGTSATSLTLVTGYGSTMPAVPFFSTATPPGQLSTMGNSEIVSVTARSGETLTIVRAQKGTTAQDIKAGWILSNGVYVDDINKDNGLISDETPAGSINSSNVTFITSVPYIGSSLEVFVNGVKQKRGTHFTETTPSTGTFTMSDAPATGEVLSVNYLFANTSSTNSDTVDGYHASASLTANTIPVLNASGKLPLSTTTPQFAIMYFSNPSVGQVTGPGTEAVSYDVMDTTPGTSMTRSGTQMIINESGWYFVVANLRIIDAPQNITHTVVISTDGGTTWGDLTIWSHRATPESTNRSSIPVTQFAYIEAGSRLRHYQDHPNTTRIGAYTSYAKYHTSLAVSRII